MRAHLRAARGPLLASFGASLFIQALNVLTGILLARELAPAGRGALAAALLWPTLVASVGSLGLPDSVTYHGARLKMRADELAGTVAAAWFLQSCVLTAIGIAIFWFAPFQPDARAAGTLMAFAIPLYLWSAYGAAIAQGRSAYPAFNALRVLVPAATASGLVGLAVAGRLTVQSATWTYVATYLLTAIAAAAVVVRGRPRISFALARDLFRFGVRSHLSFVATSLNERLDQLVVSILLAPVSLGLYVVAATLTSVTSLVGSTVSLLALPELARLHDDAARAALARRLGLLTVVGASVVTLPVLLLAPVLLRTAFGPSFAEAATPARILLVGAIALTTARLLGAVLKGLGLPLHAAGGELCALAVTVPALAMLLPPLGLVGAAIASLLAYTTAALWLVRRVAAAFGQPALAFWFAVRPRVVEGALPSGESA
jgi:O-antigen/teichoic acid export membrane protein